MKYLLQIYSGNATDEYERLSAHEAFDSGGGLADPELAATLRSIVHRLAGQALRPAA